jgi:hypothetical protein
LGTPTPFAFSASTTPPSAFSNSLCTIHSRTTRSSVYRTRRRCVADISTHSSRSCLWLALVLTDNGLPNECA